MTHEDAGHYGAKHPAGTAYDANIAETLAGRARNGKITCKAAHQTAEDFGVAPSEVGRTADLLELRINECQLGLFGYGPVRPAFQPAESISDELRDLLERHTTGGRISCASCWMIADRLGMEKQDISSACELLGTKVKQCQLGTF